MRGALLLLLIAGCDRLFGIDTVRPSGDAKPSDTRGDGAKDGSPDARVLANHDEDGDGLDDAIDPCPAIYELAQMDSDSDGVGNACDPHPDLPIDRIRYFESLQTFAPPRWNIISGQWELGADTVSQTDLSGMDQMALLDPDGDLVSPTISVVLLAGSGADAGVWMVVPGGGQYTGVGCYIYAAGPYAEFFEKRIGNTMTSFTSQNFPASPYPARITLQASDSSGAGPPTCTVATAVGTVAVQNTIDADVAIPLARAGLYAYAGSGTFQSVTVFDHN